MFTTVAAAALAVPELVSLIVEYIDDRGDLARACRIGRRWKDAAAPHLYKKLNICDATVEYCRCTRSDRKNPSFATGYATEQMPLIERQALLLQELKLHHVSPTISKSLIAAARHLTHLYLLVQPAERLERPALQPGQPARLYPERRLFDLDLTVLTNATRTLKELTLDFQTMSWVAGARITPKEAATLVENIRRPKALGNLQLKHVTNLELVLSIVESVGEHIYQLGIEGGNSSGDISQADWARFGDSLPELIFLSTTIALSGQTYYPRLLPPSTSLYEARGLEPEATILLYGALEDPTFLPSLIYLPRIHNTLRAYYQPTAVRAAAGIHRAIAAFERRPRREACDTSLVAWRKYRDMLDELVAIA